MYPQVGCKQKYQWIRVKQLLNIVQHDKYILLDVLLCSIADYFYESCRILTSPTGSSKYKQQVKMLSDTTQQNV